MKPGSPRALGRGLMFVLALGAAGCAPPESNIGFGPASSEVSESRLASEIVFRPGHAATVAPVKDVSTAKTMQRQGAPPPPSGEARLNPDLMRLLSGKTLVTNQFSLYLSPRGMAGMHVLKPRYEQAGRVNDWYVNSRDELCLRDIVLMSIRTAEDGKPRKFRNAGYCLEVLEVADGHIALAWGSQTWARGKVYHGDVVGFSSLRERLQQRWREEHE